MALSHGLYIRPRALTILGTYRCTASCQNCCFASNPTIRLRLSLSDILAFIEEGSAYSSVKLVVFSGGECFLLGDDLNTAIEYATKKGLRTRCVTNGYWAKSLEHGRNRLRRLKDSGLKELNISTGDYHQQYVSVETVINAACLGVELLENTLIVVEMQRERKVSAARIMEDRRIRDLLTDPSAAKFRIIESPWMPMNEEERIDQNPERILNRDNVYLRHGCRSIFTTVVLTPNKRLGFCCGLSRELIPELNSTGPMMGLQDLLLEAGSDFIKIWLFVDGPERILQWAASKDANIDWEGRYAHHCHACLALFQDSRVREVIRNHYSERVDDVLMRYSVLLRKQEILEEEVYG